MPNPYHHYRQFHVNRFCYQGESEGFDFSQMEAEETQKLEEDMEQMFADLDMDEAFSASDENVTIAKKEGSSWLGRAWNKAKELAGKASDTIDENIVEPVLDTAAEAVYHGVMRPSRAISAVVDENIINPLSEKIDQGFQSNSFFKARKAIKKGDVILASELFQEIKGMNRKQVENKFGLYRKYSTGKDMAYAVLRDMGVSVKDRTRAGKGEPTIDNIPLKISPQEVAQLKDLLIPRDTVVNRAVASLRGKSIDQLTDAELAGNSILNAFGGVLGGIKDLGEYAAMSVKDFFTEGEKRVQKEFDLVELGEKGDLVIRIINEKFTATQKFALYAQFITEGIIGGGVAKSATGLLGKIGQIKGIGNMFNKLNTAQSALARGATAALKGGVKVAKQATKIGTGRVAGRATAANEGFKSEEMITRREVKDENERRV